MINADSFDENVTVLATVDGDIVGIENFKGYYNNYLTGFSDAEFTIVDAFGQGNKIVKHLKITVGIRQYSNKIVILIKWRSIR